MATRRRRSKPHNDDSKGDGDPDATEIFDETAQLDREDAVSEILNKGLDQIVKPGFEELAASLKLAQKTKDLQEKRHQLERVADLGNQIRDDCRKMLRETGPRMQAVT